MTLGRHHAQSKACVNGSTEDNSSCLRKNSSSTRSGEGLDCVVCWEPFDSTNHAPHGLWCGHSLCKECILQTPHFSLSKNPHNSKYLRLPFLIPCPWCRWVTPRLHWEGDLKYPRKNFSLVWMLEMKMSDSRTPCESHIVETVKSLSCNGEAQSAIVTNASGAISERRTPFRHRQLSQPSADHFLLSPEQRDPFELFRTVSINVIRLMRLLMKVVNKLPHALLLFILTFFILPLSGLVLCIYLCCSVFVAIPSSAMILGGISVMDALIRDIFR